MLLLIDLFLKHLCIYDSLEIRFLGTAWTQWTTVFLKTKIGFSYFPKNYQQ